MELSTSSISNYDRVALGSQRLRDFVLDSESGGCFLDATDHAAE
jgi:hypothetical protein